MTALNATLTADTLTISQDGAICRPDGSLAAYAEKVIIRPARRLILASAGNFAFTMALADYLDALAGDIDALAVSLPQALADISHVIAAHPKQVVLVGGWSKAANGPAAFVCQAEDGFAPVPIQPGIGHVISPDQAVFADHDEALAASIAATQGEDVEGWHVMLALAQREAARQGLIDEPGWGPQSIGGHLTVARLDRQGITLRTLPVFGAEGAPRMAKPVNKTAGEALAGRWALRPAAA